MARSSARFEVLLTEGAERDLESIYDYISEFDSVSNANHVLDRLMAIAESLAQFPERGGYPKELESVGIKEYRQTWFKPYRVIYRVEGQRGDHLSDRRWPTGYAITIDAPVVGSVILPQGLGLFVSA